MMQILPKLIFCFMALTFVWFSLFGLVTTLSMMESGMMNCFLMNDMAYCNMGLGQHMSIWNAIFNSLLPTISILSFYLIVFFFIPFEAKVALKFKETFELYQKNNPPGLFSHPFREALFRGIINPKIF